MGARGPGGCRRGVARGMHLAAAGRCGVDTGDVGRAFAVVAELEQAGVEVAAPLFAALLSACARGGQPARKAGGLSQAYMY